VLFDHVSLDLVSAFFGLNVSGVPVGGLLLHALAARGVISIGSAAWGKLQNLTILVPFVLTIAQYYLIGLS
jgi:hypothetical protein